MDRAGQVGRLLIGLGPVAIAVAGLHRVQTWETPLIWAGTSLIAVGVALVIRSRVRARGERRKEATGGGMKDLKVDRSAFSVVRLEDQEEDEKRYWRGKTPRERLEAMETMRRLAYGHDSASARLQRVLEVARRA